MENFSRERKPGRRDSSRSRDKDLRNPRGRDSERTDRFDRRDSRPSNRNFEQPMMHKAICDKCNEECEVPFKPTTSKPIYCNSCFKSDGSRSKDKSNQFSEEFKQINEKLDKIIGSLKV